MRDTLPKVGSPDKGGRTCQSIPTKGKEARDFINSSKQEDKNILRYVYFT